MTDFCLNYFYNYEFLIKDYCYNRCIFNYIVYIYDSRKNVDLFASTIILIIYYYKLKGIVNLFIYIIEYDIYLFHIWKE